MAAKKMSGAAALLGAGTKERVRVIAVTLMRSPHHQTPTVRATLKALNLQKLHVTVYHKNIQPIRGQLVKVLPPPPLPSTR